VVARLRKDAALCDLPPTLPPGQKKGRGRPPDQRQLFFPASD
jgi:hypothetical protein